MRSSEGIMAQRVSVPAVITAIVAACASIAAALSGVFSTGSRYGSLLNSLGVIGERLSTIERKVDAGQVGNQALELQVKLLEARITGLERREGREPKP